MAKLESIEVDGYKSIREGRLELRQLNVLVGANGAGKSNLLSVFGLLNRIAVGRLRVHVGVSGGADRLLHFGRARTKNLRLAVRFDEGEYHLNLLPSADDRFIVEDESLVWRGDSAGMRTGTVESALADDVWASPGSKASFVRDVIRSWQVFHFHDTSASARIKLTQDIDDNRDLRADGSNLAALLFAIRHESSSTYRRIVGTVRQVAPFFDDFVLEPDRLNPSKIVLGWRHRTNDDFFGPDALSDGTLRFISLATLLLQRELPSVVVIDEPELGLHPFAVRKLAGLVRSASARTQLVVATQSAAFLNEFSADEIVVVDRRDDASTYRRLTVEELAGWLDEYSLGELWEKNVFGATPF